MCVFLMLDAWCYICSDLGRRFGLSNSQHGDEQLGWGVPNPSGRRTRSSENRSSLAALVQRFFDATLVSVKARREDCRLARCGRMCCRPTALKTATPEDLITATPEPQEQIRRQQHGQTEGSQWIASLGQTIDKQTMYTSSRTAPATRNIVNMHARPSRKHEAIPIVPRHCPSSSSPN